MHICQGIHQSLTKTSQSIKPLFTATYVLFYLYIWSFWLFWAAYDIFFWTSKITVFLCYIFYFIKSRAKNQWFLHYSNLIRLTVKTSSRLRPVKFSISNIHDKINVFFCGKLALFLILIQIIHIGSSYRSRAFFVN